MWFKFFKFRTVLMGITQKHVNFRLKHLKKMNQNMYDKNTQIRPEHLNLKKDSKKDTKNP